MTAVGEGIMPGIYASTYGKLPHGAFKVNLTVNLSTTVYVLMLLTRLEERPPNVT